VQIELQRKYCYGKFGGHDLLIIDDVKLLHESNDYYCYILL
jgi:hypothetical protein